MTTNDARLSRIDGCQLPDSDPAGYLAAHHWLEARHAADAQELAELRGAVSILWELLRWHTPLTDHDIAARSGLPHSPAAGLPTSCDRLTA